jgi:GNAT superfamily N-acetyltransferase
MKYTINGYEYCYVTNAMLSGKDRVSFFELAKQVFDLNFEMWYQSGFWGDGFIPYALADNDSIVSSISVCLNIMKWQNQIKRCVQISTVMTSPQFRGKGLSQFLLYKVLEEWKGKCDLIYLYANDSVVGFYPKFGFEKAIEHQCMKSIRRTGGSSLRKLDMAAPEDRALLIDKYKLSNPFSAFTMEGNTGLLMFYCLQAMKDHIYYIDRYKAIVVAKQDKEKLVCYDIFTDCNCELDDILGAMADENTECVALGFSPKSTQEWTITTLCEEDTTFFVLDGKANIIAEHRLMFPLLSRA